MSRRNLSAISASPRSEREAQEDSVPETPSGIGLRLRKRSRPVSKGLEVPIRRPYKRRKKQHEPRDTLVAVDTPPNQQIVERVLAGNDITTHTSAENVLKEEDESSTQIYEARSEASPSSFTKAYFADHEHESDKVFTANGPLVTEARSLYPDEVPTESGRQATTKTSSPYPDELPTESAPQATAVAQGGISELPEDPALRAVQDRREPYSVHIATELDSMKPTSTFSQDPGFHLRKRNLQYLDDLADQILEWLSSCTPDQLLELTKKIDIDPYSQWSNLQATFTHTRNMFSFNKKYLKLEDVDSGSGTHEQIILRVNIATAVSSILSPLDDDLFQLNKHFLVLFLPIKNHLSDWQDTVLDIFHDFKAQTYLECLERRDMSRAQLADELFPTDISKQYSSMITTSKDINRELTPSQMAFPKQCAETREYLVSERHIDAMKVKYDRLKFLRSLSAILKDIRAVTKVSRQDDNMEETLRQARLAADLAVYDPQLSEDACNPYSFAEGYASYSQGLGSGAHPAFDSSLSSQIERARLEANAKTAAKNKGPDAQPSQRRTWSTEEEHALLTGLDRVKGPHWSQILAMFGTGGTVNEVLKDRNQVQLKDKARNLKLFFLKNNLTVPHYLDKVTGELKTRAPVQAARQEAKERLRASGSEDRAAMEAASVLAAGVTAAAVAPAAHDVQHTDRRSRSVSMGGLVAPPSALRTAAEHSPPLQLAAQQDSTLQANTYYPPHERLTAVSTTEG